MPKSMDNASASPNKDRLRTALIPSNEGNKREFDKGEYGATPPMPFIRVFQPEKILEAEMFMGKLMFLMKWKGTNLSEFVCAKEANLKCPQIVIQFYEERLKWVASNENKDSPE